MCREINQLLGLAGKSKVIVGVRPDGLEDAAQLQLSIDRDKAAALGVGFGAINTALSTSLGSAYVNDYPNAGRLQRVVVQADAPSRMQPDDLLRIAKAEGRQPATAGTVLRLADAAGELAAYAGDLIVLAPRELRAALLKHLKAVARWA